MLGVTLLLKVEFMKIRIMKSLFFLFLAGWGVSAPIVMEEESLDLIIFDRYRLSLGDGELYSLTGMDSLVLIPPGVELVCQRLDYAILAYRGTIRIEQDGGIQELSKVLIVLKQKGEILYYYPSKADPRFIGEEVVGVLNFYNGK